MGSWSTVSYELDRTPDSVANFVCALQSEYQNGCVESWVIRGTGEFDSALSNEVEAARDHFLSWFCSGFGNLEGAIDCSAPGVLEEKSGFELEGYMTNLLVFGGAYTDGLTEDQARLLSMSCIKSIAGDQQANTECYVGHEPRGSFFLGDPIYGDVLILMLCPSKCLWWVLAATDRE